MRSDKLDKRDASTEIESNNHSKIAANDFERGAVEGVQAVSDILAREFPSAGSPRDNELSDEPIIL